MAIFDLQHFALASAMKYFYTIISMPFQNAT